MAKVDLKQPDMHELQRLVALDRYEDTPTPSGAGRRRSSEPSEQERPARMGGEIETGLLDFLVCQNEPNFDAEDRVL